MRPITGGTVPLDRIVGRDAEVRQLWGILENQSVVLVAERRVGKTTVLRKLEAEAPGGWTAVYSPVEGVRNAAEFTGRIVESVSEVSSTSAKWIMGLRGLYDKLAGQEVVNWSLPVVRKSWKSLMERCLADIRENADTRVVFMWDEFPQMISNIGQEEGPTVAMEVLDVLRDHRLSDREGRARMLFTGSIGLHLVVAELRSHGYRNDPTNDMRPFVLGPLTDPDARELARRDMSGLIQDSEATAAEPVEEVAEAVSTLCDGLPFYISHTVDLMADSGAPFSTRAAERAVDSLVMSADNRARFSHYVERVEGYYKLQGNTETLALAVLDAIAGEADPIREDQLVSKVKERSGSANLEPLRKTIGLLVEDSYIVLERKDEARYYRFRHGIIKRWWRAHRV